MPAMDKKYTIKDIALMARVSKGTVDRVLHKRGKVSPAALERVTAVLAKINYEPNVIARNLKNNKISRIAVILPDPKIDPYWAPCLDGVAQALEEFRAFNLSVESYFFDPESTSSFLKINKEVLELAPDAVLLAPFFYKETIKISNKYDESGIIVATFNNQIESEAIKSFVGQDLFKSGRVAAKLMNVLSANKIAIIHIDESVKNASHMQEKEKGFKSYFEEKENKNFEITTLKLKNPDFTINFEHFLKENSQLNGIFVTTSKVYQIAKMVQKLAPNKISIIGYDLIDDNISFVKEGVIDFLIHQNPKRQAYLSITNIADNIVYGKDIPTNTLLPIDIINSENIDTYCAN
ncbi:Maltose operon transcriptional repressor [Flavobacterium sp. TAB 87]|nr:Maltose operon transcriptional repressor [Flavobacterium sp. TAB 87]